MYRVRVEEDIYFNMHGRKRCVRTRCMDKDEIF